MRKPANNDEAMRALKSADELWLGEFGESIWKNILATSGYHYVSLTKISEGGAPLARSHNSRLILPDFDVYRDGRSVFVEAKAKTRSVVYWNKLQERHGIDEKNYRHYLEIQRQSGKPCCIGIVELWRESTEIREQLNWSGSLLFERLSDLLDPRAENPERPPKIYWRRKQFREIESGLSPIELWDIAAGILHVNCEFELSSVIDPKKQGALFS